MSEKIVVKEKEEKEISLSKFLWIIIPSVILIPFIMAVFLKCPIFSFAKGQVESWIGFWGSYLGGVVGLVAVVITTSFLIRVQNKHHEETIKTTKRRYP